MIGLMPPQSGRVVFHGASSFGVLFQNGALWTSMTVLENVLPMDLQGYSPRAARPSSPGSSSRWSGSRATKSATRRARAGGMRKRAAPRALALDPSVLFLDEPSAGLDPLASRRLDELVLSLRDGLGITVVLVTHELESLYRIADRMIFLDGEAHRPVALGAPAELARSAESAKVRDFFRRGRHDQAERDAHRRVRPCRPGLVVAGVLFFGAGALREERLAIVSFFDTSVAGLRVGAPVTFRGVPVGEVKSMGVRVEPAYRGFDHPGEHGAHSRHGDRVRRAAAGRRSPRSFPGTGRLTAQLVKQSFVTGLLSVELAFRPGAEVSRFGDATLPEVPTVPGDLEGLAKQLQTVDIAAVLESLQRTLAAAEAVLSNPGLGQAVGELPEVMRSLKRTLGATEREVGASSASLQRKRSPRCACSRRRSIATAPPRWRRCAKPSSAPTPPWTRMRSSIRAATMPSSCSTLDDFAAASARLRNLAERVDRDPSVRCGGDSP